MLKVHKNRHRKYFFVVVAVNDDDDDDDDDNNALTTELQLHFLRCEVQNISFPIYDAPSFSENWHL